MPPHRHLLLPSLAALAAAGLGTLGYAAMVEPHRLRIRRFAVTIPDLAPTLEGVRAAFLTDFHLTGPGPSREVTLRALSTVAGEQPDLVFLGGDFFDHADWHRGADPLAPVKSLRGQVFAVLGNHDLRRGRRNAAVIARMLEDLGVCVLRNRSVSVRVRDRDVVITGVDDPYTRQDDLPGALARGVGACRPLVLLAHAPNIAGHLPVGLTGLVLVGHTHGGQICLSPSSRQTPLDISFYLDRIYGNPLSRYQRGFHWVRGNLLFVSNGIGMTRWPLRLFAPPEVVFLTFTARAADEGAPCDSARRYVRALGPSPDRIDSGSRT